MPHPPDKEVLKELVKGNLTFHTLISRTKNNSKNIQQRHFSGFIAITLYQLWLQLAKCWSKHVKAEVPSRACILLIFKTIAMMLCKQRRSPWRWNGQIQWSMPSRHPLMMMDTSFLVSHKIFHYAELTSPQMPGVRLGSGGDGRSWIWLIHIIWYNHAVLNNVLKCFSSREWPTSK